MATLTWFEIHPYASDKHSNSQAVIFTKMSIPFNPFPNKPWFLRVCCKSLLKTLFEKEILLVTSNF